MNSENIDNEPSLQMHKLPCAPPLLCVCVGGGGSGVAGNIDNEPSLQMHKLPCALFFLGGGTRVHSAQGTAQFVDHKQARIHA